MVAACPVEACTLPTRLSCLPSACFPLDGSYSLSAMIATKSEPQPWLEPMDGSYSLSAMVATKSEPQPWREPVSESPMYIDVSSTFVGTCPEHLPEHAFAECHVSTCPPSDFGPLQGPFQEPVDSAMDQVLHLSPFLFDAFDEAPIGHSCGVAAPAGLPARPVSLAEALGEPAVSQAYVQDTGDYPLPLDMLEAVSHWPAAGLCLESPPGLDLLEAEPKEPCESLAPTELPSVGSVGHAMGRCKPCAFIHTTGCNNGLNCEFCHLCEAGERRRRRKQKREVVRAAGRLRKAATAA